MSVSRSRSRPFRWPWGPVAHAVGRAEGTWSDSGLFLGVGVLLALFLFVCFFHRFVILVNAGEAGVRFWRFYGTEVDRVYGEGVHVIPPWDNITVYNVRTQEMDHAVTLLTVDGLQVTFSLSIRYRPEYPMLGLLHQRIGPDYLDKIVIPEVDEVLRTHVGRFTAEEVYTTRRAILERIFLQAIAQVERSYVVIDRVAIRAVELPPAVRQAVEAKIQQKHAAEAYQYVLLKEQSEAKRKEIEAEGHRMYNQIISKSITPDILRWKGIEATQKLSESGNSKVIVIGNGDKNLPVIMGVDGK